MSLRLRFYLVAFTAIISEIFVLAWLSSIKEGRYGVAGAIVFLAIIIISLESSFQIFKEKLLDQQNLKRSSYIMKAIGSGLLTVFIIGALLGPLQYGLELYDKGFESFNFLGLGYMLILTELVSLVYSLPFVLVFGSILGVLNFNEDRREINKSLYRVSKG